jgi:hypothetical protein
LHLERSSRVQRVRQMWNGNGHTILGSHGESRLGRTDDRLLEEEDAPLPRESAKEVLGALVPSEMREAQHILPRQRTRTDRDFGTLRTRHPGI